MNANHEPDKGTQTMEVKVYGKPEVKIASIANEEMAIVVRYTVSQSMTPGRDGTGLDFDFVVKYRKAEAANFRAMMNGEKGASPQRWEIDFGGGASSMEQLAKWLAVASYAMSNLPPPTATLPIWK